MTTTEFVVEDAALAWLEVSTRKSCTVLTLRPRRPPPSVWIMGKLSLEQRLRNALARLHPNLPIEVLDDPDQVTLAVLSHTLLLKLLSDEIYIRDTTKLTEAEV